MSIITFEGPMGSSMTLASTYFSYARHLMDYHKLATDCLNLKHQSSPIDPGIESILKKQLKILKRKTEIQFPDTRFHLLNYSIISRGSGPIDCDIYYKGRRLCHK